MAVEPQVSTGEIATTSSPATATIPVFTQSQVNRNLATDDTGTNPPVVTLQQSQVTPSTTGAIPYDSYTGVSSADLGTSAFVATQDPYAGISSADLGTTEYIAPKGPAAAAAPADSGPTAPTSQNAGTQPGRNKFFTNDYYIDDLEINGFFTGKRGPSSFQDLSFKVTEPNGISLAYNLNRAIRDLYKQDTAAVNNAVFVMVIRFYGWDEKGKLITNVSPVAGTPGTAPNNSNAVVTKYLPFNITDLDFKMNGKVVEYHVKAAGLTNYKYAQTTALGTVPHNWQLVGETVEQVLNGTATTKVVSGDDSKRKTTPNNNDIKVREMSIKEQAAIAAGTDPNAVNDQGMAFGGGGL